jgi:hypothetical protein
MANAPRVPRISDAAIRRWLAFSIVGASVLGIVGISAVAIATAGDDRSETTRLVFSSVLPLLGTWVGTVLAFYFARENLQAATENTLRLAGVTDTETAVTQVMIPEADFVAYDLGTTEQVDGVKLADLHDKMSAITPPSRRLPVRDPSGAVLYVIHDSTLTAYAEFVKQSTTTLDKTLGDLLDEDEYKRLVEAIAFVSERATVADARTAMTSVENCNDVFVTTSGKREERAIGWLTNTLLAGVQ